MAGKIYTKTGDDGTTGLYGGHRLRKDALRIAAYGDVDELNSSLGMARALLGDISSEYDDLFERIQCELFVLGADLATPTGTDTNAKVQRVDYTMVQELERTIDMIQAGLPVLKNFIYPGGSPCGAAIHNARAICRRAERKTVSLREAQSEIGELPVQYLNRLSDALFVLARSVNQSAGVEEHAWVPNPSTPSSKTNGDIAGTK